MGAPASPHSHQHPSLAVLIKWPLPAPRAPRLTKGRLEQDVAFGLLAAAKVLERLGDDRDGRRGAKERLLCAALLERNVACVCEVGLAAAVALEG